MDQIDSKLMSENLYTHDPLQQVRLDLDTNAFQTRCFGIDVFEPK